MVYESMTWKYDIQSATAEIRRRKKTKKEERNHRAKYNALPYSTGRP